MDDFVSLATSYVLADDDGEQQRLAAKAADAIRAAPRNSAAVLTWAQSINQWMPNGSGDDKADSDVIVRAKALGFLAATLEVLDKDVLGTQQVEHLVAFFGAMFAIDHKAGILAAATALRCLCGMAHFRPSVAAAVLGHVAKLGDDFRLQAPPTRRAIYDLVALLVRNDAVLKSLGRANGDAGQFLLDLLQLCQSERDPDNLLRWFAILRRVLEHYEPPLSAAVVEAVFKAASDYFPISMRSSATPAGTTVDDLKSALRGVFAACAPAAASVFDFLLQKMDQGDALTVAVKADILATIHACITAFPRPAETVVPHTSRLWNSLKYEVRHGDVPETIDGTLRVVQAIATRLGRLEPRTPETAACLGDFVGLVLADCISDLANSTFTAPAGRLLNSAMLGGYRAYNLAVGSVLATVKKDLQAAQTASHTRDLVGVLNSTLRTRQTLVGLAASETDMAAVAEFHSHDPAIRGLLDNLFLRLWDNNLTDTAASATAYSAATAPSHHKQGQDPVVLNEVIRGLAELVVQRGPPTASEGAATRPLLCSPAQISRIFATLAPRILPSASTPATAAGPGGVDEGLSQTELQTLAHASMTALQTATFVYPEGFAFLVEQTVSSTTGGAAAGPAALASLRDTLSRVAFIGCSSIGDGTTETDGRSQLQALSHFATLTSALCSALERLLDAKAGFPAAHTVLSGIYAAALNLRDAFSQRSVVSKKQLAPGSSSTADAEALTKHFQAYLLEATAIVQRLYRRATTVAAGESPQLDLGADFDLAAFPSASALDDQDQYLHQLASFATFVIRDLDETQQKDARLHEAPFTLFHPDFKGQPAFFRGAQGGRTDVLSLGILKGLWPSVVASLADLGISPLNLLDDFAVLDSLPPRTRIVRNTLATVVVNKYSAAAGSRGPNSVSGNQAAAWKATVDAVTTKLEQGSSSSGSSGSNDATLLTPNRFARLVAVAAGAFARLDKDARGLAGLLVFAPARHAASPSSSSTTVSSSRTQKEAQHMARSLGGLLVSDRTLSTDDHAVVKSIYKQWVYGQTAKVLLPLAFPQKTSSEGGAAGNGDGDGDGDGAAAAAAARRASTVHTIAILALVRNMPFSVYEDDIAAPGALVRVLVAATTTLAPQWSDVAVALRVLSAILAANRADAVRSHLKTVIDASIRVFAGGSSGPSQASQASPPPSPAARRDALALVAQLPAHYEEGLLLPYEPRLVRALAAACGDRVREIREVAQRARESWVKVAA